MYDSIGAFSQRTTGATFSGTTANDIFWLEQSVNAAGVNKNILFNH